MSSTQRKISTSSLGLPPPQLAAAPGAILPREKLHFLKSGENRRERRWLDWICTKPGPSGAPNRKSFEEGSFERFTNAKWKTEKTCSFGGKSQWQEVCYTSCAVNLPPFLLNAEAKYDPAPVPAFQKYCWQKNHMICLHLFLSQKKSHKWKWPNRLSAHREEVHWVWPLCRWFGVKRPRGRLQKSREVKDGNLHTYCQERNGTSICTKPWHQIFIHTSSKRQITLCTVQLLCERFQTI